MLDTKALIALGARSEIERLACQLGDLLKMFPELRQAAEDTFDATIADLQARRPGRPPQLKRASAAAALVHANGSPPPPPKRKKFSRKTRQILAENMRRRWAAVKKAGGASLAPTPTKRGRKHAETPTP